MPALRGDGERRARHRGVVLTIDEGERSHVVSWGGRVGSCGSVGRSRSGLRGLLHEVFVLALHLRSRGDRDPRHLLPLTERELRKIVTSPRSISNTL